MQKTKVPRNFVLLDALKNAKNYTHVTYGLVDEDKLDPRLALNFVKLEYWNCTIMYDDGINLNIFELQCYCPNNFPEVPPVATFSKESLENKKVTKICDKQGNLTQESINAIQWSSDMNLGDFLNKISKLISK